MNNIILSLIVLGLHFLTLSIFFGLSMCIAFGAESYTRARTILLRMVLLAFVIVILVSTETCICGVLSK